MIVGCGIGRLAKGLNETAQRGRSVGGMKRVRKVIYPAR